jgi:hypothetical protein
MVLILEMKTKDYPDFDGFARAFGGQIGIFNWFDIIHNGAIFLGKNHPSLNYGQTGEYFETEYGYYFIEHEDQDVYPRVFYVNKKEILRVNPPKFD